jgi:hypothetical protein
MSQTTSADGARHRDDAPVPQDRASEPRHAIGSSPSRIRRPRVVSLVVGSILCVVALVFLAGGGWALWKDRVDRDSKGFVTLGTTELRTGQYAIVGDLRGDGPSWLYGSTVLGDARVRATSQTEQPLFIGIARKDDVFGYLRGAGYATIDGFEVRADTTHAGGAPSGPPSRESIWAASTQGTGRQTLVWTPRAGDWSILFMNADAGANVDVRGDASAKLPVLPWLAGGFLVIGGAAGFIGAWILVRAIRRKHHSSQSEPDKSTSDVSP